MFHILIEKLMVSARNIRFSVKGAPRVFTGLRLNQMFGRRFGSPNFGKGTASTSGDWLRLSVPSCLPDYLMYGKRDLSTDLFDTCG